MTVQNSTTPLGQVISQESSHLAGLIQFSQNKQKNWPLKNLKKIASKLSSLHKLEETINTPLAQAIQQGNLSRVQTLIKRGAVSDQRRNITEAERISDLEIAIAFRQIPIFTFLLKSGKVLDCNSSVYKYAINNNILDEKKVLEQIFLHQKNLLLGHRGMIEKAIHHDLSSETLKQLLTATTNGQKKLWPADQPLILKSLFENKRYDVAHHFIKEFKLGLSLSDNSKGVPFKILADQLKKSTPEEQKAITDIIVSSAELHLKNKWSLKVHLYYALSVPGLDATKQLLILCENNHIPFKEVTELTINQDKVSILQYQIRMNNPDKIALLTRLSPNIHFEDQKGNSPLSEAANTYDLKTFQILHHYKEVYEKEGPLNLETLKEFQYIEQPLMPFQDIRHENKRQNLEKLFHIKITPFYKENKVEHPYGYIFSSRESSSPANLAFIAGHGIETHDFKCNRQKYDINFVSPLHHTLYGFALDYLKDRKNSEGLEKECQNRKGTNAQYKPGEYYRDVSLAPSKQTEYNIQRACQIMAIQQLQKQKQFDVILLDPYLRQTSHDSMTIHELVEQIENTIHSQNYNSILIYTCRTAVSKKLEKMDLTYNHLDAHNPEAQSDARFFVEDTLPKVRPGSIYYDALE